VIVVTNDRKIFDSNALPWDGLRGKRHCGRRTIFGQILSARNSYCGNVGQIFATGSYAGHDCRALPAKENNLRADMPHGPRATHSRMKTTIEQAKALVNIRGKNLERQVAPFFSCFFPLQQCKLSLRPVATRCIGVQQGTVCAPFPTAHLGGRGGDYGLNIDSISAAFAQRRAPRPRHAVRYAEFSKKRFNVELYGVQGNGKLSREWLLFGETVANRTEKFAIRCGVNSNDRLSVGQFFEFSLRFIEQRVTRQPRCNGAKGRIDLLIVGASPATPLRPLRVAFAEKQGMFFCDGRGGSHRTTLHPRPSAPTTACSGRWPRCA